MEGGGSLFTLFIFVTGLTSRWHQGEDNCCKSWFSAEGVRREGMWREGVRREGVRREGEEGGSGEGRQYNVLGVCLCTCLHGYNM